LKLRRPQPALVGWLPYYAWEFDYLKPESRALVLASYYTDSGLSHTDTFTPPSSRAA
jgi:hypothetical protein